MIYNAERDSFISRVTLDGLDITQSCFFADDHIGYVAMYRLDEHGRIIADDNGNPIPFGKIGKVTIEP